MRYFILRSPQWNPSALGQSTMPIVGSMSRMPNFLDLLSRNRRSVQHLAPSIIKSQSRANEGRIQRHQESITPGSPRNVDVRDDYRRTPQRPQTVTMFLFQGEVDGFTTPRRQQ